MTGIDSREGPLPAPAGKSFWRRLADAATDFVAAPASPRPLAVLRIGVCAVLLVQGLLIAGSLMDLYGPDGIIKWSIADKMATLGAPRLRWIANMLAPFDVSPEATVHGVFLVYMAALACLALGWRTRLAAVVAWLTHLSMNVTGTASTYGVDNFANIALFYMVWMPVGDCASLDRKAGRCSGAPSPAARLSLRVLQIHLCIIYLDSGLTKADVGELLEGEFGDWWTGQAIWDAFTLPEFGPFDFFWLARVPWLAMLLGWATLVIEIGYPFLVWPRRTRKWWAGATVAMHLGIAVILDLWTFSALLIVLTWSAFLVSGEPVPQATGTPPSRQGQAPANAQSAEAVLPASGRPLPP
jgi:hypothetical protein